MFTAVPLTPTQQRRWERARAAAYRARNGCAYSERTDGAHAEFYRRSAVAGSAMAAFRTAYAARRAAGDIPALAYSRAVSAAETAEPLCALRAYRAALAPLRMAAAREIDPEFLPGLIPA